MITEVDIAGKYDYFFHSNNEPENTTRANFQHLKPISIFNDEEFAGICKDNEEILQIVTNRATDCLLAKAWRIENQQVTNKYEKYQTISKDANVSWAYHSSSLENLLSITKEGFKLPETNARQDGWGYLFLGRMIYFAPKLKNGIFYTRDTLGYIILSEIKLGKTLNADSQLQTMTPEALFRRGYDAIISHHASSKGTIYAIPCASQVNPRYLLQYRKLPKTQLLNMVREVSLLQFVKNFICPDVLKSQLSRKDGPYVSYGKIHEDNSFVTVWDGYPKFGLHCLIIPKADVLREQLSYVHIWVLLDMHVYATRMIQRLTNQFTTMELVVGIACNPSQIQLHAHLFTPHQPRPSLQKSQAKKFKYPAMRSIKDVIWYLVRKSAGIMPLVQVGELLKYLQEQADMIDIADALARSFDKFSTPSGPDDSVLIAFNGARVFEKTPLPNTLMCTLCEVKIHISSLAEHYTGDKHQRNMELYPDGRRNPSQTTFSHYHPPANQYPPTSEFYATLNTTFPSNNYYYDTNNYNFYPPNNNFYPPNNNNCYPYYNNWYMPMNQQPFYPVNQCPPVNQYNSLNTFNYTTQPPPATTTTATAAATSTSTSTSTTPPQEHCFTNEIPHYFDKLREYIQNEVQQTIPPGPELQNAISNFAANFEPDNTPDFPSLPPPHSVAKKLQMLKAHKKAKMDKSKKAKEIMDKAKKAKIDKANTPREGDAEKETLEDARRAIEKTHAENNVQRIENETLLRGNIENDRDKIDRDKIHDRDKIDRDKIDRDKIDRDRIDRDRKDRERKDRDRKDREIKDRDRIDRERKDRDRIDRDRIDRDRIDRERKDRDRTERDRKDRDTDRERDRKDRDRIDRERKDRDTDRDRIDSEDNRKRRRESGETRDSHIDKKIRREENFTTTRNSPRKNFTTTRNSPRKNLQPPATTHASRSTRSYSRTRSPSPPSRSSPSPIALSSSTILSTSTSYPTPSLPDALSTSSSSSLPISATVVIIPSPISPPPNKSTPPPAILPFPVTIPPSPPIPTPNELSPAITPSNPALSPTHTAGMAKESAILIPDDPIDPTPQVPIQPKKAIKLFGKIISRVQNTTSDSRAPPPHSTSSTPISSTLSSTTNTPSDSLPATTASTDAVDPPRTPPSSPPKTTSSIANSPLNLRIISTPPKQPITLSQIAQLLKNRKPQPLSPPPLPPPLPPSPKPPVTYSIVDLTDD